ncbi:MAG: SRPBCC family protein [Candidatus Nanopelagicales bacterium]
MNDTTNSSIKIAASVADIMAVIADVASYPQWVGGLDSVEILTTAADGRPQTAKFAGSMGMVADTYTLGYDWSDSGVSWHLIEGDKLTAMNGSYSCTPLASGKTEVEYQLAVGLAIPMVGMLRRRGERMVVDSALKGLKKRVEG